MLEMSKKERYVGNVKEMSSIFIIEAQCNVTLYKIINLSLFSSYSFCAGP